MPSTLPVILILALILLLLLALLLRRPASDAGLMQQQLIELRARLDSLLSAQHDIPRALADGRAEQARGLAEQIAQLSLLVTRQLESSQTTVGQRLEDTGRAVAEVRERLGHLAEATKRLERVGEAVTAVQELLQVPKLRGTLGEVWLEELLRQIFPASLFAMQHGFRSGERVDAVILVGQRLVPVDAKFPLEAFQRIHTARPEDAERERRAFRKSLRGRIDEIAEKYIRPDEGTFDFALMYIPAENVYYEAVVRGEELDDGGSVLAYAMSRKVIPVSPHTFYAYLSAVLHGLKGMRLEEKAREIQNALGGLEQQFGKFWTGFEKVGVHLGNAQKQFEESRRQADRISERFERLRGADDADDADDAAPRLPPAPTDG